jgi:hypothetical protein
MPASDKAEEARRLYCHGKDVEAFSEWEGRFKGQDCVVCGLGPSLNEQEEFAHRLEKESEPRSVWTFGVNDHARLGWEPDFLVLMDGVHHMVPYQDRAAAVRESCPHVATFQRLPCPRHWLPDTHRIVEYDLFPYVLSRREPTDDSWLTDYPIAHQDTTTFTAAVIAWRLGFERIGVLGCDLGHGYAWAPGGCHRHPLHESHRESITEAFRLLHGAARRLNGAEVFNLARNTQVDWGADGILDSIRERDADKADLRRPLAP